MRRAAMPSFRRAQLGFLLGKHGTTAAPGPTLVSATINTAGTTLTLVFSASVSVGAGGNGGFVATLSGGTASLTYSSGSGSTTLVYTLGRTVSSGETGTLAYTQPGNGIEATAGGADVASFSGAAITNNSTVGAWSPQYVETFLGTPGTSITARACDTGQTYTAVGAGGNVLIATGGGAGYPGGTVSGRSLLRVTGGAQPSTVNQRAKFTINVTNTGKAGVYVALRATNDQSAIFAGYSNGAFRVVNRSGAGDAEIINIPCLTTGVYDCTFEVTNALKSLAVTGLTTGTSADNTITAVGGLGQYIYFGTASEEILLSNVRAGDM